MAIDKDALPRLKLGSVGDAVKAAKMGVHTWDVSSGNTTRIFGPFFLVQVKEFQREHRIAQSGVIGPVTWAAMMPFLSPAARALLPQVHKLPDLGPVCVGGRSVLEHDCTHPTGGIALYPAFDDAFQEGRTVVAPEPLTVTRPSSSHPGLAFYADGESGIRYWFGHLDRTHMAGTKFRKGTSVGKVTRNTVGGGPHVHVGVNVERLWGRGKQLVHHSNYTHGAPLIGTQLKARSIL